MTLEKEAQSTLEFTDTDMGHQTDEFYDVDDYMADDNMAEMIVEYDDPEMGKGELVFTLPDVPGAEDDSEILVEPDEGDLEVEEPEDVEVEEKDPWDWASQGGAGKFLHWLQNMMASVPRHSGRDTTGLEKAISYFEALDKEITKAMRVDYHNEIDSAKAEEARAQIEDGLERLVDRLERVRVTKFKRHQKKSKNKKAEEQGELLVKEAKQTHVGGIVVTVPLLISRLARVCINSMVSGGHDIENTFKKMSEKYDLTKREQAELLQLLDDMGYSVRRDRGFAIDEEYDTTSSDNYDWNANYPG